MSLVFYNDQVFDEFDKLFSNEAFDARVGNDRASNNGQFQKQNTVLRPRMDIHESNERNELTATFELPGLKKEDVSVEIQSNHLTILGRSSLSNELEKDGYNVRERRYGSFSRTIPLPQGIKPEDIKATMADGILTVKLPRDTPEQAPRKITIK